MRERGKTPRDDLDVHPINIYVHRYVDTSNSVLISIQERLLTRISIYDVSGVSTRSHSLVKRFDGIYTGPYFDSNSPTNITAQLGSHAYLPCKVRQLGNKSVGRR